MSIPSSHSTKQSSALAGGLPDIALFRSRIDLGRLLRNTNSLWQAERGQTFANYHTSAGLAEKLLLESGCLRVESIAFPADGKTVYQDKTMPMGWRASKGRLEILQSSVPFEDPVIADYQRHPFHLIKGSVATPPEGIETRLISEEDLYAGADARGALILLNPEDRPIWHKYRLVCNAGALGFVTDNLTGRYETPDAIQWVNACTEGPSWHTRFDDRPFLGYSVSPITGDQLRAALRKGGVKVRACSDGERYQDEIKVVTGVIPGNDEREIWLLAHLYEPLADDNSSGVGCALEIARVLQTLQADHAVPTPQFTLRLVFAMESYGFAAYAEKRGGRLDDKVLCALNLDGLPIGHGNQFVTLGLSQSGCPSSADYVMEDLVRNGGVKAPWTVATQTEGLYGDERVLADPTIGVPVLWLMRDGSKNRRTCNGSHLWHNSAQTMSHIDPNVFRELTATCGTWTASMLCAGADDLSDRLRRAVRISRARLEAEQELVIKFLRETEVKGREQLPADWLDRRLEIESARIKDFLRFGAGAEAVDRAIEELAVSARQLKSEIDVPPTGLPFGDPVWNLAESIVITRKTRGLPHDLAAAPAGERSLSLGGFYSGPLVLALVHADGRRDVADLLLQAQWEGRCFFSPEQVNKCIGSLQYLAKHGYIDLACSRAVTRAQVVQALKSAGIREGDLLMVHSALSPLGVVEGGADTVIDALLEVIGEIGTLLMPAFTKSFLGFEKGPLRNRALVAYHPEKASVWTGTVSETFRKRPGVMRTPHVTHSVTGIGPLAAECLSGHGATDPPTGSSSPFAKLHELDGKIVFLGANIGSCTFLHYLETVAGVDYLESAICVMDDDKAGRRLVTIPEHIPRGRDFYRKDAEEAKIFRALSAKGLKITETPLGYSKVKVIGAKQFYQLGMEAMREDPEILLNSSASNA